MGFNSKSTTRLYYMDLASHRRCPEFVHKPAYRLSMCNLHTSFLCAVCVSNSEQLWIAIDFELNPGSGVRVKSYTLNKGKGRLGESPSKCYVYRGFLTSIDMPSSLAASRPHTRLLWSTTVPRSAFTFGSDTTTGFSLIPRAHEPTMRVIVSW